MSQSSVAECADSSSSAAKPGKSTYGEILRSTALIGGASGITLLVGIVRTKAMAVLLGPAGFGLAGLYMSIATLAQTLAGMGINSSGVRQIARAAESGDEGQIAETAAVLRKASLALGALGAIVLLAFSSAISSITFGTSERALSVAMLSLVVFLSLVSAGYSALIQGLRRIADLARLNILSAVFGVIVTIPTVYLLRERGIVPSLIAVAALSLGTSLWFARKVPVPRHRVSGRRASREAAELLKLGSVFMSSGLMTLGSAYLIRVAILHKSGFEATGLYQAAWTLGGMYVGVILQAMGADFYPRLAAKADDDEACNRLVNEQTSVGILLAGPGVLATVTWAPMIFSLFYSSEFAQAVPLLRWICLGVLFQVITWPMGFIIVAKGRRRVFFLVELAWTVVHLLFAWICLEMFGLNGAGAAFCASYLFHGLLLYPVVRRMSQFRWSDENARLIAIFGSVVVGVTGMQAVLPQHWAMAAGSLATVLIAAYSLRTILDMAPLHQLPVPMESAMTRLRRVFSV